MQDHTPAGWDGLLDTGEHILWQGKPTPGLSFQATAWPSAAMGLFFMLFSLYWMGMASNITSQMNGFGAVIPKLFPLFGLPFFAIGFHNAIGHVFWQAYLRSRTHYTLTNKRAFIATDHPFQGKLLRDYQIDEDTNVTLKVGPPDSVFFAGRRVGFSRISDGRTVHKLIRQIQKETS